MTKRFQNRAAESSLLFTTTAIYAAIIWLLADENVLARWPQLLCIMLSTFLMRELCNSNSLIRVRTQLVSSIFLLLTVAVPSLFGILRSNLLSVCIIIFLMLLFSTYQNEKGTGRMYWASLALGTATLVNIHLLIYIPIIWLLSLTQLQSLNIRTWIASLLGLLTPYWLLSPWLLFTRDWQLVYDFFAPLTNCYPLFDYGCLPVSTIGFLVLVTILSFCSLTNFLQKSYEDRIRARQMYGFLFILFLVTLIFLLLRPDLYQLFIPIITICSSLLIAHFFALTHTKTTNIVFICTLVLFVVVTVVGITSDILPRILSLSISTSWIGL